MMSAAVPNPHAGHERSEDTSRQLRSWSIVVLNGTEQHAAIDAAVTVNRYSFHWSRNFGWRRGQQTNRSCKVKILLQGVAQRGILLPASLQKRAGAARLRVGAAVDVMVVASYSAPSSTKNSGDIATRICRWVEGVDDKRGGRTVLLWMTDVNGDAGLDRIEEGIMVTSSGWRQAEGKQQQLSGDEEDVARYWKHLLRRPRKIQPHRPCCGATGRFGFGLLLSNAVDSGQEAAAVPHEHVAAAIEIEVPLRCRAHSDPRIQIDKVGAHAMRHQGNKETGVR